MAVFEIPTSPEAQIFTINLAGVSYQMSLVWNTQTNTWTLNIADSAGNAILNGIPLVANVDLLTPYAYLNFGGQLIAQTDNEINTPPTYDNLGSLGHLFFVTT
jgi:hypothetical protein